MRPTLVSEQLTAETVIEDTAPVEIDAPPIETELPAETDTATATGDAETATEDPLKDYSADILRNSAAVKAMLEAQKRDVTAGIEGRHKQEVEAAQAAAERKANAEAYQRQQAELQAVDNGSAVEALYGALRASVDTNQDPDALTRLQAQLPSLSKQAGSLVSTMRTRIDNETLAFSNEYLTEHFPDYRIAPDDVAAFDGALMKGDYKARYYKLLDIAVDAAIARETPKIRAAAVRDVKAEAEKTLKLQQQQSSERQAAANGGPTAVSGRPTSIGTYRNLVEVAQAHIEGKLTNAQVQAFRAMPRSAMPEF